MVKRKMVRNLRGDLEVRGGIATTQANFGGVSERDDVRIPRDFDTR